MKTAVDIENRLGDPWSIQTDYYEYSWPTKQKALANASFQIVAGYSRKHLDPHGFKLRYVDTEENRRVSEFVEKILSDKYDSKQIKVTHERMVE